MCKRLLQYFIKIFREHVCFYTAILSPENSVKFASAYSEATQGSKMEHPIPELQTKVLLRQLDKKTKAQAILESAPRPRYLVFLCAIGAPLVAHYALRGFIAPDLTGALLVGTFTGLVLTMAELWSVQRRLEAVIELSKIRENEKT